MNWFKDRMKDDLWVKDLPMTQTEIDMTRMRAYLDFAETEKVEEQVYDGLDEMAQPQYVKQPKLDEKGQLILKRK
jgi:hypothetical protein